MTASYPANSGEWHKRVSSFHSVDLVTLDSSILPVSISRTLKNALDGRDTALIVSHEKPIKSTPHQPTTSLETVGHRNTLFCVPEIERIKILEQALEEANQKVNQMNHHLWDHEQGTQITLGLRLEELEKTKLQLKTLEQIEEKQTAIIEQLLTKQESMEVLLKRQQIHSVKMMEEFARAKADTTRYFQHKIEHVVKEVTRISAVRKDLEKRMSDIQDQKMIEKRSSDIDLQRTMALEGRVEELDMIVEKLDFQKKRTSAALTRKTSAYRQMEQCLERHAAVIKTYEKKIKVLEKALEAGNLAPNRTNLLDESETTTVPVDPGEKDALQAQCQEWLAKGKEETLIYKMVEICKDNKYLIVQMQDMQNELNLWHQHAAMLRDTHRHSNPKKPISPKTHKVGCEGRPDHTLHRTLLRSTDNLENMHSFKHNSSPNLHLPPPTAPPSNPPPPIPSSPSSRSSTKPIEKDNRSSQQNIRDLKRRLSHAEAAAFSMAKKLDAVLQEKEGLDLETTRWKTQVDKLLEAQAAKEAKAAKVQQELEKQLEEERTLKAKSEKARQLLESQTDVWLSKKSSMRHL
ncbi:hypothetical protein CLU79DRAFT_720743 [Phycomyces nitens]|nr:hypothetical protein CLU79DRAFT_720743 [Phycomyces nitens]